MKKISLWLVALGVMVTLSGCGENNNNKKEELVADLSSQIELDQKNASSVCTVDYDYAETEGYVMGAKFIIYADKDGYVTKLVSRQLLKSNNRPTIIDFQQSVERDSSATKEYGPDGGYDYKVSVDGNILTVDTTIDYTKFNLEELSQGDNAETLKSYLTDDYRFTLSNIKSMYLEKGAQCKDL